MIIRDQWNNGNRFNTKIEFQVQGITTQPQSCYVKLSVLRGKTHILRRTKFIIILLTSIFSLWSWG